MPCVSEQLTLHRHLGHVPHTHTHTHTHTCQIGPKIQIKNMIATVQATAINETGEDAAFRTNETPSHANILCHSVCVRAAVFGAITIYGAA